MVMAIYTTIQEPLPERQLIVLIFAYSWTIYILD